MHLPEPGFASFMPLVQAFAFSSLYDSGMSARASAIWRCEYRDYFYGCSMNSTPGAAARKVYLVQPNFTVSLALIARNSLAYNLLSVIASH